MTTTPKTRIIGYRPPGHPDKEDIFVSWREEFGEAYEIPRFVQFLAEKNILTDLSWRNDVVPSFGFYGDESEQEVRIWIAHPLKSERDDPDAPRFLVTSGGITTPDVEEWYDDLQTALEKLFDLISAAYEKEPQRARHAGWQDPQDFLKDLIPEFYEETVLPQYPPRPPSARRWRLPEE